jgi:hypothetical protein
MSIHGAIQFTFDHPQIAKNWFEISNYIVALSIKNEEELLKLIKKAEDNNLKYSIYREPDLENQITSIAIEPGEQTKRLCKNLKLALS